MVALTGVISLFKKFFTKQMVRREIERGILEELISGVSLGTFTPTGALAGGSTAGFGAGGIFIQAQAISRALERIPILGTLAKPIFEITTTLQALNRIFLRLDSKTGRMETLLTHVLEMFQTAMHIFFFPIATALGSLLLPLARIFLWIGLLFMKTIYPHLKPLLEWGMRKNAWDKLFKGEPLEKDEWYDLLFGPWLGPLIRESFKKQGEAEGQSGEQGGEQAKQKQWWEHILDFLMGKWFPEAHAMSAEAKGSDVITKALEPTLKMLEKIPVIIYSSILQAILNPSGITMLQRLVVVVYSTILSNILNNNAVNMLRILLTVFYSTVISQIFNSNAVTLLQVLPSTIYSLMVSEVSKGLNILREFGSWLLSELKSKIVVERYVISIPTISGGGGGGGGGGSITYTSSRSIGSGPNPMPSGPFRTAMFAMQHGGLITEPVYGLGLVSGRTYLLGEAGPERVTPLNRGGGSGNIVVNIHIAGSVYGINDLKRIIDDAVAEVTKRRLSL